MSGIVALAKRKLAALSMGEAVLSVSLNLKAVSKERPRSAKGGHFYTPERTRQFEAQVAHAVANHVSEPVCFPVVVTILVYDRVPKSYNKQLRELALAGLLLPAVGDLDNKEKAIKDAMNGIVYLDDNQITKAHSERYYAEHDKILIEVSRCGLSRVEIDDIIRQTKGNKNGNVNNRSGAKVG